MPLKRITTRQFIAWSVLITVVFAVHVASQGRIPVLGMLPLVMWAIMPPETSKRPVTRNQLLAVLGWLLAMAAFIWWVVTHHTPESDARNRSLLNAFSHPVVAVPLWLGLLFLGYRRWR